ncbi:MAG TPA: hypothetical protein VH092_27535 [Urbifossiella sp.]|nr:hypothetical protein [Urbifossiella sp.]
MTRIARPVAVAVVFVAALAAGCSSNNTGKIVGKWKATAAEIGDARIPAGADVAVVYEFTADGRFSVAAVANLFGKRESKSVTNGKYRLGMGNTRVVVQ